MAQVCPARAAHMRASPATFRTVRSVVDFYRQRPAVAVIVVLVGLAVALATESRSGDGVVLPIFLVAIAGVLVGGIIAFGQQRRRER